MKLKKVINDDWSESHKQLINKWALLYLDGLCDPLRLLFMTFFDVIEFILSKSFQWHL